MRQKAPVRKDEKHHFCTVSFPINGPAEGEWEPLRAALKAAWSMATRLANWGVRELLKADPGRRAGDDKLRPMPEADLYKLAFTRKRYPDWREWAGATNSASCILRRVSRKYGKERIEAQWQGSRFTATYRYPFPWPVHPQSWSPYRDVAGHRCVSLTLPGGRFCIRLRGGLEFAHQARAFDLVLAGNAKRSQLFISRQSCSESCHRRTLAEREPGGGRKVHYREMVRIAVSVPKGERSGAEKTLIVATNPKHFWVAQLDGRVERPWLLNADHVTRREAQHADFLQRISEDLKPEKRWPKRVRVQINEHRAARCLKHNRFIATWTQQAAAMLAEYCKRQQVGCVVYEDSVHSYCEGFPWSRQRLALAHRLERDGIELVVRGATESDEDVA